MDKEQDLLTFLEEAGSGLSNYHNALRNELKIEAAHELWNVHDQDLTDIRMLPADIQKLRKHLRKEYPNSALGKLKKLTSVSVKRSLSKKVAKSSSDGPIMAPTKKTSGDSKLATPVISSPRPIGKRIIPPNQVVISATIGTGEFGKVHRGVWTDEAGQKYDVALKTLAKDKMGHGLQEFLKEAGYMQSAHHPSIVEFYGVVFDQNSLMLVTEYAPMRSLLECLQSQPDAFGVATLCRLSEQVADGMSYLESQRLVHRDLAARNILVFSTEKVKVSDFGLSQALGLNRDYYETKYDVNLKLPIAWSPPESIKQLQFSSASDVWSFGVTLWEMFSYAQKPWGMMSAAEILAAIDLPSGQRLEKPPCCPRNYYELMRRCWEHEPSRRPKFADIVTELPHMRPLLLRAVRSNNSTTERLRGMLQYAARDVITVLDDRPINAPSTRLWLGVNIKDARHPGFFDATDVEPIGTDDGTAAEHKRHSSLPKESAGSPAATFRFLGKSSPSKASQRRKITSEMIGKPESDLRHTGHIGYDGVMFGDVSFIGNNYDKLPVKVDSADGQAISATTVASYQSHPVEELSDFQFPDLSLTGSLELSTSFIDEMMKELHSDRWAAAGEAAGGRQQVAAGDMQRSQSDTATVLGASLASGDAVSSRNGNACEILPGNRERKDSCSSPGPGSVSLSNGGTSSGIKAMSAADEKLIDEAIELANHFASSSLQSAHTPRDADVEPDTPSKSKSRFSFKLSSKKTSPVAERKTFTDDLVQKSATSDAILSPEAEEAYNVLVAKGSAGNGSVTHPPAAVTAQVDPRVAAARVAAAQPVAAAHGSQHHHHQQTTDVDREPERRASSAAAPAVAAAEADVNPFRKLKEGPMLARTAPRLPGGGSSRSSSTRSSASESSSGTSGFSSLPRAAAAAPRGGAEGGGGVSLRRPPPPPLDLAKRPPVVRSSDDVEDDDDLIDMPSSPPPPVPLPRSLTVDDDDDDEGIGAYNNMDPFWRQEMRLVFEADEEITGMQGHYKSRSETVSYEDLLEFSRTSGVHDRDKTVQVLLKVFGKEVSESQCLAALRVTSGDLLGAVKYIKLRQLRSLELGADVAACKEALMNANWDVQGAADYVLDRRRRVNSDIVDV